MQKIIIANRAVIFPDLVALRYAPLAARGVLFASVYLGLRKLQSDWISDIAEEGAVALACDKKALYRDLRAGLRYGAEIEGLVLGLHFVLAPKKERYQKTTKIQIYDCSLAELTEAVRAPELAQAGETRDRYKDLRASLGIKD